MRVWGIQNRLHKQRGGYFGPSMGDWFVVVRRGYQIDHAIEVEHGKVRNRCRGWRHVRARKK